MKNVIIKYSLTLCLVFTLLATVYYFLLISSKTANNELAIKSRGFVQNLTADRNPIKTDKKTVGILPDLDRPYSLQVAKWDESSYVYTLYGKFEYIEPELGIIYIKDKDNKVFAFKLSGNFKNEQKFYENIYSDYSPLQDIINIDNKPFTEISRFRIMWDDTRPMDQILTDHSNNTKFPLNYNSNKLFFLTKAD